MITDQIGLHLVLLTSRKTANAFVILCSHGNKCAGIIAGGANNDHCGVGLAYNAKIAGKA